MINYEVSKCFFSRQCLIFESTTSFVLFRRILHLSITYSLLKCVVQHIDPSF